VGTCAPCNSPLQAWKIWTFMGVGVFLALMLSGCLVEQMEPTPAIPPASTPAASGDTAEPPSAASTSTLLAPPTVVPPPTIAPTSTAVPSPTPTTPAITITQLKQAYDTNQITADNQFKGQVMVVSGGVVRNISRVLGRPYVSISTGANFELWSLQCSVRNEEDVLHIANGQRIILRGVNEGMSLGTVRFKDCEFRPYQPDASATPSAAAGPSPILPPGSVSTPAPTSPENPTPMPVGSRNNPVPFGEAAEVGNWRVKVLSTTPNATDVVLSENRFNDPPEAGHQFYMANIEVTYIGPDSAMIYLALTLRAIGESAVGYNARCGVVPGKLENLQEIFTAGTIRGSVCWQVRTTDVNSLVMYIEPGFSLQRERVFMSLR
jgi:hypothetical protein